MSGRFVIYFSQSGSSFVIQWAALLFHPAYDFESDMSVTEIHVKNVLTSFPAQKQNGTRVHIPLMASGVRLGSFAERTRGDRMTILEHGC